MIIVTHFVFGNSSGIDKSGYKSEVNMREIVGHNEVVYSRLQGNFCDTISGYNSILFKIHLFGMQILYPMTSLEYRD